MEKFIPILLFDIIVQMFMLCLILIQLLYIIVQLDMNLKREKKSLILFCIVMLKRNEFSHVVRSIDLFLNPSATLMLLDKKL